MIKHTMFINDVDLCDLTKTIKIPFAMRRESQIMLDVPAEWNHFIVDDALWKVDENAMLCWLIFRHGKVLKDKKLLRQKLIKQGWTVD